METVPRAVREQAKRAEELRKQHYEQPQPTDTDADPAPAPGDGSQHDNLPPKQPETPDPAAQPDPQANASEGLEERYRKLEEAHRALQGKYNAEVPRLTQQLREANDKLAEAQKQAVAAEGKASEAKEKLKEHLAKVREEYGDDLANAFESVASVTSQQQDTQGQQQGEDPARERFWRSLDRHVPDFDAINRSPEFNEWLKGNSQKTGLTLKQELNAAGADLDVMGVVEIVREFKSAQATKQPIANAPEQQIAPDRRHPQQQVTEAPTFTAQDFKNLQWEIAQGKWRGREAEAKALEAKIHASLISQNRT